MIVQRHLTETELNDHVEGLLPPAAAREVEEHLAACPRCAGEAAAVGRLLEGLAALPLTADPDVDLRPGIREAIQRRAGQRERREALRSIRWPLAAAAVLLVVATATITALLLDPGIAREGRSESLAEAPALAPRSEALVVAAFEAAEAEYLRTAAELARVLELQRGALSPEAARLVEENLRAVEAALREARAALAEAPSPVVRDMVLATHEKRIDVLRWAASIAGES